MVIDFATLHVQFSNGWHINCWILAIVLAEQFDHTQMSLWIFYVLKVWGFVKRVRKVYYSDHLYRMSSWYHH